jgi:hypothetical protein
MNMKKDKNYKSNLKKWSKSSRDTTITKKIYRSTQVKLEKLMDYDEKKGKRPCFVEMMDILADEGLDKRGIN